MIKDNMLCQRERSLEQGIWFSLLQSHTRLPQQWLPYLFNQEEDLDLLYHYTRERLFYAHEQYMNQYYQAKNIERHINETSSYSSQVGEEKDRKVVFKDGGLKQVNEEEKYKIQKKLEDLLDLIQAFSLKEKAEKLKENLFKSYAKKKKNLPEYIFRGHPLYPKSFKKIKGSPLGLFFEGNKWKEILLSPFKITVVGSRKSTTYGEAICRDLISVAAKYGITICSGLALGIDGMAHKMSLHYKTPSLAVLPCGIDQVYPRQHDRLKEDLLQQGGLCSEYPPETLPKPYFFRERNRIMSLLGDFILIPEAGENSGTLLTANYAAEYSKRLGVFPGSIYHNQSRGCHQLIQEGALLMNSPEDFLHYLNEEEKDKLKERRLRLQETFLCEDEELMKQVSTMKEKLHIQSSLSPKLCQNLKNSEETEIREKDKGIVKENLSQVSERNKFRNFILGHVKQASTSEREKENIEDVGEKYGKDYSVNEKTNTKDVTENKENLNQEEKNILKILGHEEKTLEELVRYAKLPLPVLLSTLSLLHIKGILVVRKNRYAVHLDFL